MLLASHDGSQVLFDRSNGLDVEALDQDLEHVGRDERRQRRSEANVFHSQGEQGKQQNDRVTL